MNISNNREIRSYIRNYIALAEYRKLPAEDLATQLFSHSQPHMFMAYSLNKKISLWNPGSNEDLRIQEVWNRLFSSLTQKNVEGVVQSVNQLKEACPAKENLDLFPHLGLEIVSNDLPPLPAEVHLEEYEEMQKLYGDLMAHISVQSDADDFADLVSEDLQWILRSAKGRELLGEIVFLLKEKNSTLIITESNETQILKDKENPSIFHFCFSRTAATYVNQTDLGLITLYMPFRFVGLAHELEHFRKMLSNPDEFNRDRQTAASHPLLSNKEEERVITTHDAPFLKSYYLFERFYHWGGVNIEYPDEFNFCLASRAGLSGDLLRYTDVPAEVMAKELEDLLHSQGPQASVNTIASLLSTPDSRPKLKKISPLKPPIKAAAQKITF
ncbi:MAG: hypothetical protein JSS32_05005 [Verrucomicrobia bacterium]|nr:hypothetical protein [Verrucomicrobiota bacterium]